MNKHTITLLILILILGLKTYGQDIKTLIPKVYNKNDYSKSEQLRWQKALEQYSKINSGKLRYDTLSNSDKLLIDSLEMGFGPLTEGPGCSWYCGGGPYKITSSTYLQEDGKITYQPNNVHDFDLFTAWIPDSKETNPKVNFHFKPLSPRINKIRIYNGYIKNGDLWKKNSRAKKIKLYINNKSFAILELKDTSATQIFEIEPIQSTNKIKDLILTFEIIEVFKGTKYSDVAISEINFSGLDVH